MLGVDGEVCSPCNKQTFKQYGLGEERSLEEWENHMGIRFKDRSVQQSVIENKEPQVRDEPFNPKFRHPIEFDSHRLTHDDYSFAAIIFEDEQGNQLWREDAQEGIVQGWKRQQHILMWKEYNGKKPSKWIVWPYSKSKGWVDKIEVVL